MSSCTTARFTFAKRGWIAGSSSWEEILTLMEEIMCRILILKIKYKLSFIAFKKAKYKSVN